MSLSTGEFTSKKTLFQNVILDEEKILEEIEENKKKPAKEGRFQRRLRKLQEAS